MYIHDLDLANEVIETLQARLEAVKTAARGVFTDDPAARRQALQELHSLIQANGWPRETCSQCGILIDRRRDGFGYHQGQLFCIDCIVPETQNPEPKT